jgi:hypothetical protein
MSRSRKASRGLDDGKIGVAMLAMYQARSTKIRSAARCTRCAERLDIPIIEVVPIRDEYRRG